MMRQAISKKTGAAECLGEILSAGGLSVVGHQDDVVVCKGLYYRCGEFVGAWREKRHHRHFPAYVQRPFEGDVEILGLVLHCRRRTVAYGDWKCRTHPTSGLLRMTPRWKPASIVGRTPFRHRPVADAA